MSIHLSTNQALVGMGLLSLALGLAIGTSLAPTSVQSATPESCLSAIDEADHVNTTVEHIFTNLYEAMTATIDGEYSRSDRINAETSPLSDEMKAAKEQYNSYADSCRSDS